MWGISEKIDDFLKTKRAARERADHSAGGGGGGGGGGSAWGVWGGGATGKSGKSAGNAYLDERRKEEAERIRAHLDRVVRPAQWERVSGVEKRVCLCTGGLFSSQ